MMSLNQAQRIAVSTTMLHLERSLDEIERLLAGPTNGVTYTTEVNLAPATAQQLQAVCADIRSEIAAMVERFELPPHRWYGRQVIMAEMTSTWTNLEEIRPERLRRFGAVDPTLTETLAPRLERLIQLIRDVQNLASRGE
jgi:hypothetical protein